MDTCKMRTILQGKFLLDIGVTIAVREFGNAEFRSSVHALLTQLLDAKGCGSFGDIGR